MRQFALASVALAVLTVPVIAQDALRLQRGLDKSIELSNSSIPIGEVFAQLTSQTGVKFTLSPDALEMLPYGDQTRVSITVRNVTLRKALSPMLSQQALQWAVEGDGILISPKEGLYRLGRRATHDELRVLGLLYSAKLEPIAKGGAMLSQLQKICNKAALRLVLPTGADRSAAIAEADKALPGTAAEWLEAMCQSHGWTWYLQGDELVILELKDQVARQLQRQVSLKYQNARLMDVLLDLAKKARVKLVMDPGVLTNLPAETQESVNLTMNASVGQALEALAGATGLKFTPMSDGVKVEASAALQARQSASAPARPRLPFFIRKEMTLANGMKVEVFIPPTDLPDDAVQDIMAQREKVLQAIRDAYPSKPSSQPASQPSIQPAASMPASQPAAEAATEGQKG